MNHVPPELKRVVADAEELGVTLLGVCGPQPDAPEELARLEGEYQEFIASGNHGDMNYLAKFAPLKYRAETLLPNCRSVLMFGLNYYREDAVDAGSGRKLDAAPASGRIARYARGRDYHKTFGKKLLHILQQLQQTYPEDSFRRFTDSGPLAERSFAAATGACVTGRNTLSISPLYGSYFFLGEVLSTHQFPDFVTVPAGQGCPRGCRACINVCPTGALSAPYRMDARSCISYLTIEHKGLIPVDLQEALGDMVFGCDLCQEVCPLNAVRRPTTEPDLLMSIAGDAISLSEILRIKTHEEMTARFGGSPLMRSGRRGMLRNACVAAANLGAQELLDDLLRLSSDEDELVAQAAAHARERLIQDA
ncbi:MAG: tRNA epoxyqueuosine(34) reductase QueG [Spirochaetaceae bacterium]|nr:MAG: tRNA epoxyqueuosine(34) reductase QueG [Spirochaetaceae bacterium]